MRNPTLTILSLVLPLMGCSASTATVDGAKVVAEAASAAVAGIADEKPPAKLRRACKDPAQLPVRKLSAGEVERYMRKDGEALIQCGEMHDAVIAFYADRDRRLQEALRAK